MLVLILENRQRLLAAIGLKDLVLQLLQHVDDQHAHDGIVFDDQEGGGIGGHDGVLGKGGWLFRPTRIAGSLA
ncbi:hypothetical protein D3C76_1628260 [compost metagenome]